MTWTSTCSLFSRNNAARLFGPVSSRLRENVFPSPKTNCFCLAFPSWNRAWTAAARGIRRASRGPRTRTAPASRKPRVATSSECGNGVASTDWWGLVTVTHSVTPKPAERRVSAPCLPCSYVSAQRGLLSVSYLEMEMEEVRSGESLSSWQLRIELASFRCLPSVPRKLLWDLLTANTDSANMVYFFS